MTDSQLAQVQQLLKDYVISGKGELRVNELQECFETVRVDQRYDLINRTRDSCGNTAVHISANRNDLELLSFILNSIGQEHSLKILMLKGYAKNTAMHWVALQGHNEATSIILQAVPLLKRFELLQEQNELGYTPIHWAAWNNHTNTILSMLLAVSQEQRVTLLEMRSTDGETAIHWLAWNGHTDTLKCLLATVIEEQILYLLGILDSENNTAYDSAVLAGNEQTAQFINSSASQAKKTNLSEGELSEVCAKDETTDLSKKLGDVEETLIDLSEELDTKSLLVAELTETVKNQEWQLVCQEETISQLLSELETRNSPKVEEQKELVKKMSEQEVKMEQLQTQAEMSSSQLREIDIQQRTSRCQMAGKPHHLAIGKFSQSTPCENVIAPDLWQIASRCAMRGKESGSVSLKQIPGRIQLPCG
ncbi:ankyrin repeat, PH and SEC7 domain containing protein secG-like [Watersipora subatra]|uniref:ankyrin repeat, PH and SEC7 domain containing protein secG-like n=1 Tax=Watersipora subatra TaxID=2589382 RepID=UPI00355AF22C